MEDKGTMDITLLFKACVKSIKTKNRAFGSTDSDKSRILQVRPAKQEFTLKSKEIVQHITRLHDFLMEHQQAYLNFFNHLVGPPQMSDAERDKIDAGVKRIINTCSNFIADLEHNVRNQNTSSQKSEHENVVVTLLREYLKHICTIYSEQRAIRVQQTMKMKKLVKIESFSSKNENCNIDSMGSGVLEKVDNSFRSMESNLPAFLEGESLSSEELQIFALENNELYNELNSLTDEVRLIENKVVKITELQELFTEKVLQQDKDMSHIATMVVGTTENVKDANDLIRQAIQRNAGLRVWILFFLLVMSFSLLFLDWYNE